MPIYLTICELLRFGVQHVNKAKSEVKQSQGPLK